ncbi:NAD(P)H-dependent oxidoreductase [Paenibacillus barengoltzii]|jgi:glutathione-regulated potassium-efflux system ancillary protein KefG|uniref:NAD(P)H-dependent oxidoreductase n=1 Tax=Paenibacillus barengoltzii TaxID=343517 RepID=UPI003F8BEDCB
MAGAPSDFINYGLFRGEVEKEQRILLQYDRIVFQFPFYWYSCPPLLKKWFDDVLTFGWAYGPGGGNLLGKEFMLAIMTGGTEVSYRSGGDNSSTISEFLRPIEKTLARCNGTLLPAFVAYGVKRASAAELAETAAKYMEFIRSPRAVLVH